MISTAEYVRPCGDGCHQRKQEACSGDQWNCPRIAGYRRAPIGSEKTGPILEARACGIEACGIEVMFVHVASDVGHTPAQLTQATKAIE